MVCMDSALQGLTQSLESFDRAANRIAEEIIPIDWTGVYWRRLQ